MNGAEAMALSANDSSQSFMLARAVSVKSLAGRGYGVEESLRKWKDSAMMSIATKDRGLSTYSATH